MLTCKSDKYNTNLSRNSFYFFREQGSFPLSHHFISGPITATEHVHLHNQTGQTDPQKDAAYT